MYGLMGGRKETHHRKKKRVIYKYIKGYMTGNIGLSHTLTSLVGTIQKVMCLSTVEENLG